jgi:polar amino acid transport system permease protein
VPVRHPGRWVGIAVLGVLAAMLVHTVVTNPRFGWSLVWYYFRSTPVVEGLVVTIWLTVAAMVIGVLLGTVLALLRLSPNPVLRGSSWAFVWFFRGTPLLVQLIFWYNLSALFPRLSLGIPFGPEFVQLDANRLVTATVAALLGLGLNEGAYMSEIIRAGITSVDEGQSEAATALGMTRLRTMWEVVLPQAMRVILPPTGNETINMLKTTSLVSVVAVGDLLHSTQLIIARTYQTMPLLIMASLWYIVLTSVFSVGQYYLERHYTRGHSRSAPLTLRQQVRANLGLRRRPGGAR